MFRNTMAMSSHFCANLYRSQEVKEKKRRRQSKIRQITKGVTKEHGVPSRTRKAYFSGAQISRPNILLHYCCYFISVKNINYRFRNTKALNLSDTTSQFRIDGMFITADVQATFHMQRIAMLKLRFHTKSCMPSPKPSSVSPSNNKLKKISAGLSRCHFIFYKKILPYTNWTYLHNLLPSLISRL
jgi:hypothetical protein